jgi:hypothetical protein
VQVDLPEDVVQAREDRLQLGVGLGTRDRQARGEEDVQVDQARAMDRARFSTITRTPSELVVPANR